MKSTIYITNDQNKIKIGYPIRHLLKKSIKSALIYENFTRDCEVSVTIVDNEKIREMNLEHRKIDRATDVLSFPMDDEDFNDGEKCILGDIVISAEKAAEQAESYGHSFKREIAFLCVHSVLHLLGYDHETSEDDEKEMFDRQKKILEKMKIRR